MMHCWIVVFLSYLDDYDCCAGVIVLLPMINNVKPISGFLSTVTMPYLGVF